MKRIFIGGLGRSGTTIALNALYNHQHLSGIGIETKFLVEEDGFFDLIRTLTTDFSTATVAAAITRFDHLMRLQVTGMEPSKFTEQTTLAPELFPSYLDSFDRFRQAILLARYFPDRAPLIAATRCFIAETFDNMAIVSAKVGWAEKTPANIWRVDFLRELWPDLFFLHMLRDPRPTMVSWMEKGWLPADPWPALQIFSGYVRALVIARRRYRDQHWFLEMRLEDFVADLKGALAVTSSTFGLADFTPEGIAAVSANMTAYYEGRETRASDVLLTPGDKIRCTEVMMAEILELGYRLDASW